MRTGVGEARPLLGPVQVHALVITGCSIKTNLELRTEYADAQRRLTEAVAAEAERCRQAGRPVPDVRLRSVKSRVFSKVC